MRKESKLFIDSWWFIILVVPIASGALGVPVSILWATEANGDTLKLAMGYAFAPFCALAGFLIIGLLTWMGTSAKEDNA